MEVSRTKDEIILGLFRQLCEIADEHSDGHLTILRFTKDWRIGFMTPNSREDIDEMFSIGDTFKQAAENVIHTAHTGGWG